MLGGVSSRRVDTNTARLVGVSWEGAEPDQIELRSQHKDGSWSPWLVATKTQAADSTGSAPTAKTTEPIWVDDAASIEVRGVRAAQDVTDQLTAILVQSPTTTADEDLLRAGASSASPTQNGAAGVRRSSVTESGAAAAVPAYLGVGSPVRVYTRAEWGADESLRTDAPEYSYGLRAAVIHHTDTANGYGPDSVPAIIRSIYLYHVQANGWRDMGYNALVDQYGRVWEGRSGGLDLPVIGAHALGFNARTFGISMIGTFTDVAPPAATTEAVAQMIAWKMRLSGITDPQGVTQLTTGSAGTRFAEGSVQNLPRVMGHRDVNYTSCPGDTAYPIVPLIRNRVGALQAASPVGPGVPSTLTAGRTVTSWNGAYRVTMQYDGNLVVSDVNGQVRWASNTSVPGSSLQIDTDGNVVILDPGGRSLWSTAVYEPGSLLRMRDDGNLVLYSAEGAARWDSVGSTGHRAVVLNPVDSIWALDSGASVATPSGRYRLTMQPGGNLVLTTATGAVQWETRTNVPGSVLRVQPDGNVVIYDSRWSPVWATSTYTTGGILRLHDDGNLVFYTAYIHPLWDSAGTTGKSAVYYVAPTPLPGPIAGQLSRLDSGQIFRSANGAYLVVMQSDGNLVVYDSAWRPKWATMTFAPGSFLVMQSDGNLVMYDSAWRPKWATMTFAPGSFVIMQGDGNLVLYSPTWRPLWDSWGVTGHQAVRLS